MKNNHYLTNFPKGLYGSPKRKKQDLIRLEREKLMEESLGGICHLFGKLIPHEFLSDLASDKRKRVYSDVIVFWAWMSQILCFNASCSAAVSLVQSWRLDAGLGRISSRTASYCIARGRLALCLIMEVYFKVVATTNNRILEEDKWNGKIVFSIDGSSVQLLDTPENQDAYPQPSSQKEGCGFPVLKVMGLLNHCSGIWEDFCEAHPTEHDAKTMSKNLNRFVRPNGLLLADRAFCSFEIIHRLKQQGMDIVMRLHQMRAKGFTLIKGKRIGKYERLVTWKKPKIKPKHCELSKEEWDDLDDEITMRVMACWYVDRNGKKARLYLATTLLDNRTYDWLDIVNLYATRWDIELRLRDVKTTMKMEELRVKSPKMARKCLAMAMLGYNLIRAVAQEAAGLAEVEKYLMSYKETLDWINSSVPLFSNTNTRSKRHREQLYQNFIEIASTKQINYRPYRWEPRLIKKRPKPSGRMQHKRKDYKAAHILGDEKVQKYQWFANVENALN